VSPIKAITLYEDLLYLMSRSEMQVMRVLRETKLFARSENQTRNSRPRSKTPAKGSMTKQCTNCITSPYIGDM